MAHKGRAWPAAFRRDLGLLPWSGLRPAKRYRVINMHWRQSGSPADIFIPLWETSESTVNQTDVALEWRWLPVTGMPSDVSVVLQLHFLGNVSPQQHWRTRIEKGASVGAWYDWDNLGSANYFGGTIFSPCLISIPGYGAIFDTNQFSVVPW